MAFFDPNLARQKQQQRRRLYPRLSLPVDGAVVPSASDVEPYPSPDPYVDSAQVGRPPQGRNPDYHEQGIPGADGEATLRRRVADPLEHKQRVLKDLAGMELEPQTGRQKVGRMLQQFGATMLESPAHSGADVATNALRGAARSVPNLYGDNAARAARNEEMQQVAGQVLDFDRARRVQEERKERAARLRLTNAQATYAEARPDLEATKAQALADKRERDAVLSLLRMHKGVRLDPMNPTHSRLLERAAAAGVEIDPDAWNNARDNLVPLVRTDPDHPERTQTVMFNRATGTIVDKWQKGFQAPRDASGNTASQNAAIEDRRKLLGLRARNLELETQNKERELATGIPASAARAFSVATAGLSAQLTQKRQEIAKLHQQALAYMIDPAEAEARIGQLETEVDGIVGQMQAAKDKALAGSASSPRSAAPARSGAARPAPREAGEFGEDPDVRVYADEHFHGDHGAAQMEIDRQRRAKGRQ